MPTCSSTGEESSDQRIVIIEYCRPILTPSILHCLPDGAGRTQSHRLWMHRSHRSSKFNLKVGASGLAHGFKQVGFRTLRRQEKITGVADPPQPTETYS
jgi:hypothetical protein